MTIGVGLPENEFANLVQSNAFRKLLVEASDRTGRVKLVGILRRPKEGTRHIVLSSRRHEERSFRQLNTLVRFAKNKLGAQKLELNLENVDP